MWNDGNNRSNGNDNTSQNRIATNNSPRLFTLPGAPTLSRSTILRLAIPGLGDTLSALHEATV